MKWIKRRQRDRDLIVSLNLIDALWVFLYFRKWIMPKSYKCQDATFRRARKRCLFEENI
jgi:hypothetical protein